MDLPAWLGIAMARRDIVDLLKPLYLTEKFFNQVKASADVVTMPNHSSYIYEVVLKLIELYPEEKVEDIMTIFINSFIERFDKIILDHCSDAREA